MTTAALSLPLGKDREYFVPEIVFEPLDAAQNTPVVYLPQLIAAQEQPLIQELEKAAWQAWCADYQVRVPNGDGCDEESLPNERREKQDYDEIIFVKLGQDGGAKSLHSTPELKLARYGSQTVRVYGPQKIKSWETAVAYEVEKSTPGQLAGNITRSNPTPVIIEKEIDLSASEKIIMFNHLSETNEELEAKYQVKKIEDRDYDNKEGNFDFEMVNDEFKTGRFNQQQETENTADLALYITRFQFGSKTFRRYFNILGNRSDYNKEQVIKVGRKTQIIREVLVFSGEEQKTIKYWYDDPIVTVLQWTDIVDINGVLLDHHPNNAPPGDNNFKPKKGKTFFAEKPCWGSLLIEYETTYTEFRILYDFPEPFRQYEVLAGNVEKVGFITLDKDDKVVERGDALEENDVGFDKLVDDPDWLERNPDESNPPKVALKLFKKIQFQPFTTQPIEFFYTNGRQTARASFTPPTPNFMDMPMSELPKIAIFEQRRQEKTEGGAEVEHIEEITFADILGNITHEKMEKRV